MDQDSMLQVSLIIMFQRTSYVQTQYGLISIMLIETMHPK